MKATDFKIRIKALNLMSRGQRDTLRNQLQGKEISDAGVKLIEQSLTATPPCPHCDSGNLYRGGTSCNLQRYRCRDCKRTFNALTHAPLARLHYKDRYEQAMVRLKPTPCRSRMQHD